MFYILSVLQGRPSGNANLYGWTVPSLCHTHSCHSLSTLSPLFFLTWLTSPLQHHLFLLLISVLSLSLFNGVPQALLSSEPAIFYQPAQCRERRRLEQKQTLMSSGGDYGMNRRLLLEPSPSCLCAPAQSAICR